MIHWICLFILTKWGHWRSVLRTPTISDGTLFEHVALMGVEFIFVQFSCSPKFKTVFNNWVD